MDAHPAPAPAAADPALDAAYAAAAAAVVAARSVVVTTHLNPDGDGIGAGLALVHALLAMGKDVRFLCPSTVAGIYRFLPRFEIIRPLTDAALAKAEPAADLVISCDAGDVQRLGACAAVPRGRLINLDHHVTNTRFGDINLVDVSGESSGVVVERLLRRLGVKLDRTLGECLYATIVFDTGRFMHSNTTAHTFRWTADLLDTGIDAAAINRRLTYTRTPKDLAILRLGLEHLELDADPRLGGIVLTAAAIAAVGEPEDWGDLVEIPRSLQGNQIAYLIREGKDGKTVRASLRSNPPFAVGGVAQHFGGGGHAQAAGCTLTMSLGQAVAEIRARLRVALDIPQP
jgi:phosphoesterase RecJ-like protein